MRTPSARRLLGLGFGLLLNGVAACGDSKDEAPRDPPGIGDEPGIGFTAGKPVSLKGDGAWQWVDLEGARCQDGSNTGFFVQKGSVNRLVLYFEGGGACFDEGICESNPQIFDEQKGAGRRDTVVVMHDKTPGNPFKGWNKVFMGYCSGDIYSGIRTDGTGFGGRTQQGFKNVGLMLERVVPTFTGVADVVLTGSSAGGFGAMYNWLRTQEAFDAIEVTLLDDSGPPLSDTYITPCFQALVGDLWGWNETLPGGCTECSKAVSNVMPYYLSAFPNHRFSLMTYTQDSTIRLFFGFGRNNCMPEIPNIPAPAFEEAVNEVRDVLEGYDNFALWTAAGSAHTFLIRGDLEQTIEDVKLSDWLVGAIDGGKHFKNVGP